MSQRRNWPGTGCECEWARDEKTFLKTIFEHLLQLGRSPTVEELQSSLGKSYEKITCLLGELERKDALQREKETQDIISIYPFSLKPTEHRIAFEGGPKLFAMCATDALGAPTMFNKNARISSRCEMCRQSVTVEIKGDRIAFQSHPTMMICIRRKQVYPAAESCCPWIKFFCSKKHADEWIGMNLGPAGDTDMRVVKQEFSRIRRGWKRYGALLLLLR